MRRNICVVTGSRAEYGLLYWLLKEIQADDDLKLQLVVTGMHLSPEFGLTYKHIEEDGFRIAAKIEMLLSSDTPVGISKSIGLGIISCAETLARIKPDILVGLGDRFDLFAAVVAAMVSLVPVAHIHGGEATEGVIDEPIRHSITKMSHLHFTSTEAYRKRVIQLGEHPKTVFNVGALGLDSLKKLRLLGRAELEKRLNFRFGEKTLLVTFHSVTLERSTAESQFRILLAALDELKNTKIIFTKPNADTNGRILIKLIDDYVARWKEKAVSFTNMGQLLYLSTLQYVDAVVGNSSSGIIEMPSFKKGTINIGDRQRGRIKATSVIDCDPDKDSLANAFLKLYSPVFQNKLKTVSNPYGRWGASAKIIRVLKAFPLDGLVKKEFYDILSLKSHS
jgi:GDP/UDP-N,N'-diacetylbacillosamine 2-epimerase (hydrolysing)